MKNALLAARQRFANQQNIVVTAPIEIQSSKPQIDAGLQAVDYCLWALYRLLERGEERYVDYIQPIVSVIRDPDADVEASYGVYYTKRNPIAAQCIRETHDWIGAPGI
ncbi:MAG: hypothetical protein IGR76_05135 [Synechococcales cyanobacterium T60_A2020_003]|nr:hypothetical protein [Synechococcales cyanobacterium T60_A2020_003]